ncbi:unnamed protein product [Blepharisma stoltei]|uniref:Uncharacterized protein n=1 Tax=Blepharisma stoltei TaxID=1481888 RepID=A0AAU9JK18_9CILI|nr:unnamed protein product [Blepharisma stoltei]
MKITNFNKGVYLRIIVLINSNSACWCITIELLNSRLNPSTKRGEISKAWIIIIVCVPKWVLRDTSPS